MQRFALLARLGLAEGDDAFAEIAEHLVGFDMAFLAAGALDIGEMPFEQSVVRNDLRRAAVLVIVDRELLIVRSRLLAMVVGRRIELAVV